MYDKATIRSGDTCTPAELGWLVVVSGDFNATNGNNVIVSLQAAGGFVGGGKEVDSDVKSGRRLPIESQRVGFPVAGLVGWGGR